MNREIPVLIAVLGIGSITGLVILEDTGEEPLDEPQDTSIKKFDSAEEFVSAVSSTNRYYAQQSLEGTASADVARAASGDGGLDVERSSDTNIQVSGVGEPDIMKNTGEKIYYSPDERHYYWRERPGSNTSVFSTLPAHNFSEVDKIPESGKMFLTNQSIISLGDSISAYDRGTHELLWQEDLNASVEAARKIDGELYFVLVNSIRSDNPCPVRPMSSITFPCTEFYHPETEELETTYSLVKMDAESGEILESNGFAGSRSNTVVYVSRNSLYLTYSESLSGTNLLLQFLEDEGGDYLDEQAMDRIEELRSYNISDRSLRNEIERAIRNYYSGSENPDEAREDLEKGLKDYVSERKRELSTTLIAKFDTDLELESQGEVPGKVNDRFSLDESDQGLRVSTTVGNSWRFDIEPENDLYTLDQGLEIQGSVTGMGLNERIYSTRYIDDSAYVVTFRRIDPFHVIDVSDHENPELKGLLKLPGFSSYLHPLQENRILGVGEENGTVKAVIFDVENDDPEVLDSKVLEDYYSEISSSPHAFQIDRENKVFFLPGSEGGHFFSYDDGLEQVKKVELENAKRAAFVNQYFYVFNNYNATVVDTDTWDTVREIQFRDRRDPEPEPLPGPIVR